ncbi:hypothetical protein Q7A53_16795 [Halobacillus rhizosphaerae]|uniref:hypothetical protein n=1 Tax=Halobacillus rhizosphaerae TaxID=3064889 RepID=UPI00398B6050
MVEKRQNISKKDKRKDIAGFIYVLAAIAASPFLNDYFNLFLTPVILLAFYPIVMYLVEFFNKDKNK